MRLTYVYVWSNYCQSNCISIELNLSITVVFSGSLFTYQNIGLCRARISRKYRGKILPQRSKQLRSFPPECTRILLNKYWQILNGYRVKRTAGNWLESKLITLLSTGKQHSLYGFFILSKYFYYAVLYNRTNCSNFR